MTRLFYVQDKLNGKSVVAMVHNGVTHIFIRENTMKRLGFQPEQTTFKYLNSDVQSVVGVAKDVLLKLGDWRGSTSFTIVPMDDFKVVLRQEFMRKEKIVYIQHMNILSIFSWKTLCLAPTTRRKEEGMWMSYLQLIVANNQIRHPCGDELGIIGVMLGPPNARNEERLMSIE